MLVRVFLGPDRILAAGAHHEGDGRGPAEVWHALQPPGPGPPGGSPLLGEADRAEPGPLRRGLPRRRSRGGGPRASRSL